MRKVEKENENLRRQLDEQKGKRWIAEARLIEERKNVKKLLRTIKSAYQHLCGNGSKKADEDMMVELAQALDSGKQCNHVNSVENENFIDCDICNPMAESVERECWK